MSSGVVIRQREFSTKLAARLPILRNPGVRSRMATAKQQANPEPMKNVGDAEQWTKASKGYGTFKRTRIDQGITLAALQAGESFLDVATGTGEVALKAAERGAIVTAVDFAPGMIESLLATAAARLTPVEITARVMDGQDLDLADSTFDVVHSSFGVGLFPDYVKGVQEMVRVAKLGGRVVVVSPAQEGTGAMGVWKKVLEESFPETLPVPMVEGFKNMGSLSGMKQILEDAGLVDVEVVEDPAEIRFDDPADTARDAMSNPFMTEIKKRLTPSRHLELEPAMRDALAEAVNADGGYGFPIATLIGCGKKPVA